VANVSDTCRHFPRGIPDGHVCDAALAVLGDTCSKYDRLSCRPFVGPAGHKLQEWLRSVGLDLEDFYKTNVFPYQTQRDPTTESRAVIAGLQDDLIYRLSQLSNLRLVVPCGDLALEALTGIRRKYAKDPILSKWRGSILKAQIGERNVTVVGTIHPSDANSEPNIAKTALYDWRRIARLAKRFPPSIIGPDPRLTIATTGDLRQLYDRLKANPATRLSFDIETDPSQGEIICCCFATRIDEACSAEYLKYRHLIKDILELPNPKDGQNFLYDAYWLAQDGIRVSNLQYDAGSMFHCLDPNAGPQTTSKDIEDPNAGRSRLKPYSLAYMTSVFTDTPYYKEQGRDEEGRFMRVGGDSAKLVQLQKYNALDGCNTLDVNLALESRLEAERKLDVYKRLYVPMYEPLLDLMLHGVQMDMAQVEPLLVAQRAELLKLQAQITELAGMPLATTKEYKRQPKNFTPGTDGWLREEFSTKFFGTPWVRVTGKSISAAKLKNYLYKILKLPARKHKGKLTTDEEALVSLRLEFPEKCGALIDAVLAFRDSEKVTQYLDKCDADGRVRCTYKQLVQTGRLSSSKNPKGTGLNLQTPTPKIRHLFVPDPGCLMLELDLSQAEDRVLKILSGNTEACRLARLHPSEFDAHTYAAARLFSAVLHREIPLEAVTKQQRNTGKRVRHAKNYGMQARKLQEVLLKEEGIFMPLDDCLALLRAVEQVEPWVGEYQAKIRNIVRTQHRLRNSFGAEIDFTYDRHDEALMRRAYAFLPQSTVGRLLNQQGLIPLHRFISERHLLSRINLQVHDALVISVRREEAYGIMAFTVKSLEEPNLYALPGEQPGMLSIPVEIGLGTSWAKKNRIEWKRLPSEQEFLEAYDKLAQLPKSLESGTRISG
jgi:uracil-DNA glycosylase family 4